MGHSTPINVWTSFKRPRLRPNLQITGHSYQICTDRFNAVWFATLVFNRANNISVDVTHVIKGPTPGNVICSNNLPTRGVWLLLCQIDSREVRDGFYKVTGKARIRSGGSGSSNGTARFDLLDCR